ncbi:hypothetical protein [Frankia tisae]|uniref:hypothetical protein n=1 Tax=Frankia tisae TaxID=2950104 RepID=UPI0021BE189C|nr:hypothetical protein [Frankia tisae]
MQLPLMWAPGGDSRLSDQTLNAAYSLPSDVHGVPGDEDPSTCSPTEIAYAATIASATAGDLAGAEDYADLCAGDLPAGFQAVIAAHLAVASFDADLDRSFVEAAPRLTLAPTSFRSLSGSAGSSLFISS